MTAGAPMPPRRATRAPPMPDYAIFHRVLAADDTSVRAALVAMRQRLDRCIHADALDRAELVLAEVMTNIVRHGDHAGAAVSTGGLSIHLSVACHHRGLACAVCDNGIALPAGCLSPGRTTPVPTCDLETMPEGGFGWMLINGLTQSLSYFRENERNLLVFNIPHTSGA